MKITKNGTVLDLGPAEASSPWNDRSYYRHLYQQPAEQARMEHERIRALAQRYGVEWREMDEFLAAHQNKGCELCGRTDKRLVVDHDHQSGALRGMLCTRCNTLLGHFENNPEWLREFSEIAAKYLSGV